jgi:hypothetical protein
MKKVDFVVVYVVVVIGRLEVVAVVIRSSIGGRHGSLVVAKSPSIGASGTLVASRR